MSPTFAAPPAPSSPSANHKGLKLVQETESSGIYDVWVSHDAIRVYSRSNQFYIAARAPLWQLEVWRSDRRQFAQMPFEQFMKADLLSSNRISYLADLKTPNRTDKQIRGRDKLLIYHFPPIESVSGSGLFISDRKDGNDLDVGEKLRPQLICFDNNFAIQVSQILGKIYNLPRLRGFPVSAFAVLPNNKTSGLLNCTNLSRNFEFNSASLRAPDNFKKKTLDKKMFFTTNQAEILDEMTSIK